MNKRISPLSPLDISSPPPFQPQSFDDPAKAVETLTALYERNTAFLRDSFKKLAEGDHSPQRFRAFYPEVSMTTSSFALCCGFDDDAVTPTPATPGPLVATYP